MIAWVGVANPWRPVVEVGGRSGVANPTDGARLGLGVERGPWSASAVGFAPLWPRSQINAAAPTDGGSVWLVAADRWTVGLEGARDVQAGAVPLRVGGGPQLRRAVTALEGRGVATPGELSRNVGTGAWDVAAVAEVGAVLGGRVRVVPAGFARASLFAAPHLEVGLTTDLQWGPRR
jgi:hypothetical protein